MNAQSILVPVDYTDVSHDALKFAMNLAHDMHSHVTVLHIEPTAHTYEFGVEPPEDLNRNTDVILRELERNITPDIQEGVDCEFQIAIGDPAHRIVQFADTHDTDLIVMGTHGRSGFSRFFMGSVAETVMREAHCPVFIVKHNTHPAPVPQQESQETSEHGDGSVLQP